MLGIGYQPRDCSSLVSPQIRTKSVHGSDEKALALGVLGVHGQPGDRATLQLRAGPGPRPDPSQVINRKQVMQLDFKIYEVKEVTESNQQ